MLRREGAEFGAGILENSAARQESEGTVPRIIDKLATGQRPLDPIGGSLVEAADLRRCDASGETSYSAGPAPRRGGSLSLTGPRTFPERGAAHLEREGGSPTPLQFTPAVYQNPGRARRVASQFDLTPRSCRVCSGALAGRSVVVGGLGCAASASLLFGQAGCAARYQGAVWTQRPGGRR